MLICAMVARTTSSLMLNRISGLQSLLNFFPFFCFFSFSLVESREKGRDGSVEVKPCGAA